MASITTFLELIDLVLGEAAYGAYTDWGAVADRNFALVEAAIKDIGAPSTAGGTANALTVTAQNPFTTYQNGRVVGFIAASDNTSAATLNVNGIGAKSIRFADSSGDVALLGGEIQAGLPYIAVYNSALNAAAGGWMLLNPTYPVVGQTTPTPTPAGGSFTNVTAVLNYRRTGKWVGVDVLITQTNAGTGTGSIGVPLPFTAVTQNPVAGLCISAPSFGLIGNINGANIVSITRVDGSTAIGTGFPLRLSGQFLAN